MWISNVQTLPSDFFPNSAVGTVAGLGGMAAGISSILLIHFTAPLISKFGYGFILAAASGVAPIAALLLFFIAGPIRQLRLIPAEHRDR
jgi:ACS family hexuronate transporter-like MFS transporter